LFATGRGRIVTGMTETTQHRPTLVLGGTGKAVTDGVERVLGRPPRDLADYAPAAAASGAWNPPSPGSAR
jgi:hypothetical protein